MKLGIVSSGRIVSEFLTLLPELPQIEVVSMCVRPQSLENARELLRSHGLTSVKVFTGFDEFLSLGGFDFIYIGSANHMHFPQAMAALKAGRNVILEKPITCSPKDTAALFSEAANRGLWLFEAITTPYMPGFRFLKEHLPYIGTVRAVTVNFSKRSARYGDYLSGKYCVTFDPDCFGGALNDMGVYSMFLTAGLFGAPQDVMYLPNVGTTGADMSGTAVWQYPDFSVTMITAKDSNAPCGCVIQGDKGFLELQGMPSTLEYVRCVPADGTESSFTYSDHRMIPEFRAFENIWRSNDRKALDNAAKLSTLVSGLLCATGVSRGQMTTFLRP